jgi:hypothetical protein
MRDRERLIMNNSHCSSDQVKTFINRLSFADVFDEGRDEF